MLMPANRVYEVLGSQFAKLSELLPDSNRDGSAAQAMAASLRLLATRELHGRADLAAGFDRLRALSDSLCQSAQAAGMADDVRVVALEQVLRAVHPELGLDQLEMHWRRALQCMEDVVDALNAAGALSAAAKAQLRAALTALEVDDLLRQLGAAPRTAAADERAVTLPKLAAYLQDRFAEPTLAVTSLQPLSGGFGKETLLFSVAGKSLSGEFVMRRDMGDGAVLDNDCHHVDKEFGVITAVRAAGFPAPDALWLDTEHALLPGGDFIVMRRSPGTIGGSFFGAQTQIPADLAQILAQQLAALHRLPPLSGLGDLTESINTRQWQLSRTESIRTYLTDWYRFWRSEVHAPSPALASLYAWLFDHIPARRGAPALLHGDVGFHNFLVHDGQLSALLDWEFAHIGDPAEDLGYIKVTTQGALDWDVFMEFYIAAGGEPVDADTLRFFQVWTYVRNASAANVLASKFTAGHSDDLKLCILPYLHIPHFIRGAQALIEGG